MNGDPILRFEGVSVRYSTGVTALQTIDLELPRGSVLALVGPSGCGKSTLLRVAAGLETPSQGRLQANFTGQSPQPVAVVFQDPTLLPWRSVADNVALPLRLRHRPEPEVRPAVADALERVGLSGFEQSYPRELSGGMRMRVSIARALVTQPEVMLLDEPFAALDELTRQRLQEDLLQLAAAQRWSMLFVTHSAVEAIYLADRVAVLSPRPGRLQELIPIDLPRPRSPALLGAPAFAAALSHLSQALRRGAEAGARS